jgi:Right handed beta helix region
MARVSRRRLLAKLAIVGGAASLASIDRQLTLASSTELAGGVTIREIAVAGTGTAAIQAAVDAAPNGGVVRLPSGTTHDVSTVTLPSRDLTILMFGATVRTTSTFDYAFVQQAPARLEVYGGRFTGVGNGILYRRTPSDTQSYDFAATGVTFSLPASRVGIKLTGARESTITNCYFGACTGIYLKQAVNTHVVGCQFRDCARAVHADGSRTGSPHDAGLLISDATMLGCGYGVDAVGWDWASIVNSMIDYCDRPVSLTNVDTASIVSSYLSNRNAPVGSGAAPVVEVVTSKGVAGGIAQHVRLTNNQIISRASATPDLSVGVRLSGVSWCSIINNSIHFWQRYGVQVAAASTYLQILGNTFNPAPGGGPGTASIVGINGDDETWIISDNTLGAPIANITAATLRGNIV